MYSSLGACALTAAAGAYGLWFGAFSRQAWFEFAATFLSAVVGAILVRRVHTAFVRGYGRLREAADPDYAINELVE